MLKHIFPISRKRFDTCHNYTTVSFEGIHIYISTVFLMHFIFQFGPSFLANNITNQQLLPVII